MQTPRRRISLRSLMMAVAVCALFLPMLGGISGVMGYRASKWQEAGYREAATQIRASEGGAGIAQAWEKSAADLERRAEMAASNAHRFLDAFITAATLVGLGLLAGGLAIYLRIRCGPGVRTGHRPASYLYSTCSTLAIAVLTAFAISAILQIFAYSRLYFLDRL